jgi:hypothetical protein
MITQIQGVIEQPECNNISEIDFSNSPVILAGHSHVFSLTGHEASDETFKTYSNFSVDPVNNIKGLSICNDVWPRTCEYWEKLSNIAKFSDDFTIAISLRGNDHLARFLLLPQIPIDFYLAELPDLISEENVQIVPQALIEELFSKPYEEYRTFLKQMRQEKKRIILIGTPPPKSNDVFLKNVILNENYFVQMAKNMGITPNDVKFTPLSVRLKLWHILQSILKKIALEEDLEYLAVPQSSQEIDGSLRCEFWANDCTHANDKYGKLVLSNLHNYLKSTEA